MLLAEATGSAAVWIAPKTTLFRSGFTAAAGVIAFDMVFLRFSGFSRRTSRDRRDVYGRSKASNVPCKRRRRKHLHEVVGDSSGCRTGLSDNFRQPPRQGKDGCSPATEVVPFMGIGFPEPSKVRTTRGDSDGAFRIGDGSSSIRTARFGLRTARFGLRTARFGLPPTGAASRED